MRRRDGPCRSKGADCLTLLAIVGTFSATIAAFGEELHRQLKRDPEQEYYVYLPRDFDSAKRYWLFVAVHGLGGNGRGALGWSRFADEGQCIVVGPTFTGTFQFPWKRSDTGKKMVAIFAELAKEYRLHRKLFLTGISAGAQFAHRFTLGAPRYVLACAAHSAGSWSAPSSRARGVPFLVTCGEDDTERIAIAKKFAGQLKGSRFRVATAWFEGVGHSLCAEARTRTNDFYWLATTGLTAEQREQALTDLEKAQGLVRDGDFATAVKLLRKLAGAKRKNQFTERAGAALSEIEKTGREKLAGINSRAEASPETAIADLEKLRDDFQGTKVSAAAGRALQRLKAGKPRTTTETGERPKASASPAGEDRVRRECKRWLMMARNYIANGKPDMARRYLSKIIGTYPDREEAREAKKLQDGL